MIIGAIRLQLVHTGYQISSAENADAFFKGLLCLEPSREYIVPADLIKDIFGIEQEFKVRLYDIGDQKLEIFIGEGPVIPSVSHICLKVEDREQFVERALDLGFRVYEREREGKHNLIFIYDGDGNPYEMVE